MVPSCSEGGVFGVLPGMVGSMQASEAIKILAGLGTSLSGRLLLFDSLDFSMRFLNIRPDPQNPVSGHSPTITQLIDYEAFCAGPESNKEEPASLSVLELKESQEQYFVLDVREPYEYEISNLGAVNIPLRELGKRKEEIPKDRPIVVHCKSGVRSLQAIQLLEKQGFDGLYNLEGGILAWQLQVDPDMAVY